MYWAKCVPKINVYLEAQSVTSFGSMVFLNVIKVRIEIRSYWIRASPKSNENVFIRDRKRHKPEKRLK